MTTELQPGFFEINLCLLSLLLGKSRELYLYKKISFKNFKIGISGEYSQQPGLGDIKFLSRFFVHGIIEKIKETKFI